MHCVCQIRLLIGDGNMGQYTARGGSIDYNFFCQLMGKKVKSIDNEAELKDAFRLLDRENTGYITTKEMVMICKKLGEDLTEEEVDSMIHEAISNYVRTPATGRLL